MLRSGGRGLLGSVLAVAAAGAAVGGDETELADPMDRSVLLSQRNGAESESGTAFFVQVGERTLLVTAEHVAEGMRSDATLRFRGADGEGRSLPLRAVVDDRQDPWRTHETLDLAAAVVVWDGVAEADRPRLRRLVWPEDSVHEKPVRRGRAVRVVGFPLMKGVSEGMSATVLSGHVATRPILSRGDWGVVRTVYLTPPGASGASGSPVYLPGDESGGGPKLCGLVWGTSYATDGPRFTKAIAPDDFAAFLRAVPETESE